MYLRDMQVITGQHRDALHSASAEVTYLIAMMAAHSQEPEQPQISVAESDEIPNLVTEDWEMGDYSDDMD